MVIDKNLYILEYYNIEDVAYIIGCSVDTVRRIPFNLLPYSKPGKRNRYRKEDIDSYMISIRNGRKNLAANDNQTRSMIDMIASGVRGAKPKKGIHHA